MKKRSRHTTRPKSRWKKPTEPTTGVESHLEESLLHTLHRNKLFPTLQHIFHKERLWRFDFAFVKEKVAIEVQGFGPGHNSRQGMQRDYEKHNAALNLGWKILYFTGLDLNRDKIDDTLSLIFQALGRTYENRKNIDWTDYFRTLREEVFGEPP